VVSCGAKSFIKDFGEEALSIVNPRDCESISDGIIKSLNNNDEIREKTRTAFEKVKKHDWKEKAKEVAKINQQCLDERR
jgi:glycosyltransferase involved in cell wall biosynthesis